MDDEDIMELVEMNNKGDHNNGESVGDVLNEVNCEVTGDRSVQVVKNE